MPIEPTGRQHVGLVDRHALGAMDRHRITVIDILVVARVQLDHAPVVGSHRQPAFRDLSDSAERAILHVQRPLVATEDQPVACGEPALPEAGLQLGLLDAELPGFTQEIACHRVELPHVGFRMRQHDASGIRLRQPVGCPAFDQMQARVVVGGTGLDAAGRAVAIQRLGRALGS